VPITIDSDSTTMTSSADVMDISPQIASDLYICGWAYGYTCRQSCGTRVCRRSKMAGTATVGATTESVDVQARHPSVTVLFCR
jgi:hypothetical protein